MEEKQTRIEEHASRIQELELWRNKVDTYLAVRTERDRYMDQRFDRIEQAMNEFRKSFESIRADSKKVVWLVIVTIIGGIMQFIIRGGLAP